MDILLIVILIINATTLILLTYSLLKKSKKENYDYFGGNVIDNGETVGESLEQVPGFGDYNNWEYE